MSQDEAKTMRERLNAECIPDTAGIEAMSPMDAYAAGVAAAIDAAIKDRKPKTLRELVEQEMIKSTDPIDIVRLMHKAYGRIKTLEHEQHRRDDQAGNLGLLLKRNGFETIFELEGAYKNLLLEAGGMQMAIDDTREFCAKLIEHDDWVNADDDHYGLRPDIRHWVESVIGGEERRPRTINLNDEVTFALTAAGVAYAQNNGRLDARVDANLTMQLWEFANIFGPALTQGGEDHLTDCNFLHKPCR